MATLYLEESLLHLEDGFCTELASSVLLLVLVYKIYIWFENRIMEKA